MSDPRSSRLQDLQLGQGNQLLEIDSSQELGAACLALITQAQRELLIMSRHLDGALYDTPQMGEALREFALGSRNTRVRILVKDPTPAVRESHRFIALAQRLSWFIEIRVPAPEFAAYNGAFLVADRTGYVHRHLSDRHEATVEFNSTQHATELAREFDAMWESAQPDSSMRRLSL